MFLWVNVLNSCHFPPLRLVRIYVGWSDSCSRLVIHFVLQGGLKGRAESVILHLDVDFIKSRETAALGMTGLLLMNKYKGLNVPRGKTPDPVQHHHNKVLFFSLLTLPYVSTFALPSAHWEAWCPLSLCMSLWHSVLLTCIFWNDMRCSQIFAVIRRLLLFLTTFIKKRALQLWKKHSEVYQKNYISQILPTVSFLRVLFCSRGLDILHEGVKFR